MHTTVAVTEVAANPFAMLLDPASVVSAMDRSDRLARLKRQVYRPLDKPLIARTDAAVGDYDDAIDEDDVESE